MVKRKVADKEKEDDTSVNKAALLVSADQTRTSYAIGAPHRGSAPITPYL